MPRPKVNPTGRRYGKWTVRGIDPGRPRRWMCLCDPERGGCGRTLSVDPGGLRSGASTQCLSCSGKERAARDGMPKGGGGASSMSGKPGGNAARAKRGLPPLKPGGVPIRSRKRLGLPALRALCDRAEREQWDAARLVTEIRTLTD